MFEVWNWENSGKYLKLMDDAQMFKAINNVKGEDWQS
jgi:hypothetical protein